MGPDLQNRSIQNGYNQDVEDRLLEGIGWPKNGYRLFEISSLADSSKDGWFPPIAESNCLFMSRDMFDSLGGFDEMFDFPGGGLVNLDFYKRACELPDSELVMIMGEGTFHQVHAGVATNAPLGSNQKERKAWHEQYVQLRNEPFSTPVKRAKYIGHMPAEATRWLSDSLEKMSENLDIK